MNKDLPQFSDSLDELEIEIPIREVHTPDPVNIRHSKAQNIVKNNVIAAMAAGLVPVPVLDIVGTTNIQFHMITVLTEHYDVPAENISKSLIASVLIGTAPVISVIGLCSLMKSMPCIGTLAGSGSVSVLSGAVTYALGQVFLRHFEQGGTLEDFKPESTKAYFQEELENGKKVVRDLVAELKEPEEDKKES